MAYTYRNTIHLGQAYAGLSLKFQLVDNTGANVGSPITTGVVELGLGDYVWTHAMTDGFIGSAKVYDDDDNHLTNISIYNETPETLDVHVSVVPIASAVVTTIPVERDIEALQHTAQSFGFAITEQGSGDAIDQEGKIHRLVVYRDYQPPVVLFQVEEAAMSVVGNSITVPLMTAHTANVMSVRYDLWDLTSAQVLARGDFHVRPTAQGA